MTQDAKKTELPKPIKKETRTSPFQNLSQKGQALIALIITALIIIAGFSYVEFGGPGGGGGGDEEEPPARIHATGHTVPAKDPFFSVGSDFLVIKAENLDPELVILFNNTRIYIDTNNDQVWDYDYLRNASDELVIENVDAGARIHTDKPVWYRQCLEKDKVYHTINNVRHYFKDYSYSNDVHLYYHDRFCASTYSTVPPLNNLHSNYFIYPGTWYIVVPENADIHIDTYMNGTIDKNISASVMKRESITISNHSRIYSNKTFYLYSNHAVPCPSGNDFYLWNEDITKLIITQDNTTVEIDNNNDGVYDVRNNYDTGIYTPEKQKIGAHVHSNKPINIVQRNYFTNNNFTFELVRFHNKLIAKGDSMSYLPPSTMMGSDYYGINETNSSVDKSGASSTNDRYVFHDYQKGFITGSFSNTSYYQDKLVENDLWSDANDSIGANQVEQMPNLSNYTHIWGSKPFSLFQMKVYRKYAWAYGTNGTTYMNNYYRQDWSHKYAFYSNLPAAYIYATTSHTPNELGLNTTATMKVRIFNPTADTNITNVSVTVKFPDSFSLTNGTKLDVTVKKYFLRNDTFITSDTKTITPAKSGGNYTFILNSTTFSDIFDYMDIYRYYLISYRIRTPTTAGNYDVSPVQVEYDASTWSLPGNR